MRGKAAVQAKERNQQATEGRALPSADATEEFRRVMEKAEQEDRERRQKAEARAQAQQVTTEAYVRALAALASAVEHMASQLDKLAYPAARASGSGSAVKSTSPAAPRGALAPTSPPEVPDRKAVGAALVALTKVKGPDAAFAVLERHGARTLSDLPAEKYAAVLDEALTAGATK